MKSADADKKRPLCDDMQIGRFLVLAVKGNRSHIFSRKRFNELFVGNVRWEIRDVLCDRRV
jgi:hypothetical protein